MPDTAAGRGSCALRCNLQFAAILLQLTEVPSFFFYEKLQRGAGAVEGGCEVRDDTLFMFI